MDEDTDKPLYTFDREFHEIVANKEVLRRTTEKFLNNLIDDITLGIIFDAHRKFKTKAFDLDRGESPTNNDVIPSNLDIFGQSHAKKMVECGCPKCGRDVPATGFAAHLESCMGLGRSRSRNVTRRIINNNSKELDSGLASDDDGYWDAGDKRKKKKYRNRNRKGKGTPKKTSDSDITEPINIDIEGEDESDITNLRELLQDNSNGSSPADSASTSNSSTCSTKKKEKSKNKKSSKRERINILTD